MSRSPWLPAVQRLCAGALILACQHRGEPPVVQRSAATPLAKASGEAPSSPRQPGSEVVSSSAPPAPDVSNARASSASLPTDRVEPYPPGRWRLADPARLDSVMLWFRQILIRHRDSPAGLVSLQLPHWRGAPPPPPRSREEAFALAQSLALEAQAHPERFAPLAQARSEDIATRHLGGAVGGMRASAVRVHVVLDVLAALRPGQVSRVVETGYGFHVFQRLPPPHDRRVSGARIVIAHEDAPWLSRFLARWPTPQRSKAHALELAEDLHRQLRADPARFDELLQQWSDHQDAVRGGDFGEWSTREPTAFPRELEVLQRLQPGEVAAPMDSLFGIQIIRRTPSRQRATYAYTALRLRYEPAAPPGADLAEARVAERARAIADDVYAFPSAFQAHQRELGGSGRFEQVEGRGEGPIEGVLAQLRPGQVARAPLRLRNEYLLLQRLALAPPTPGAASAPDPAERDAIELELPAPEHAELEGLVAEHGLRWLAQAAPPFDASAIDPALQGRARALLDALPATRGAPAVRELAELEKQLEALLGADAPETMRRLRAGVEATLLDDRRAWRLVVPAAPADFFAGAQAPP